MTDSPTRIDYSRRDTEHSCMTSRSFICAGNYIKMGFMRPIITHVPCAIWGRAGDVIASRTFIDASGQLSIRGLYLIVFPLLSICWLGVGGCIWCCQRLTLA